MECRDLSQPLDFWKRCTKQNRGFGWRPLPRWFPPCRSYAVKNSKAATSRRTPMAAKLPTSCARDFSRGALRSKLGSPAGTAAGGWPPPAVGVFFSFAARELVDDWQALHHERGPHYEAGTAD